eukprot:18143-Heterococcus_DN1.PRE.3
MPDIAAPAAPAAVAAAAVVRAEEERSLLSSTRTIEAQAQRAWRDSSGSSNRGTEAAIEAQKQLECTNIATGSRRTTLL